MTDFIHEPYKTIYVRELIKLSLDDLLSMMASLESGSAYWVDGVLFACFAMTESEELAKKEIQGQTYLDKVIFAKYENYTKTAKLSTRCVLPSCPEALRGQITRPPMGVLSGLAGN